MVDLLRSAARPRVRPLTWQFARQRRPVSDEGPSPASIPLHPPYYTPPRHSPHSPRRSASPSLHILSGLPLGEVTARPSTSPSSCSPAPASAPPANARRPSVLDFGSVLVGSPNGARSLINPTAVALYYSLTFEQNDGPPPAILAGGDGGMHPLLTMEEGMTTGVVPAQLGQPIHGDDASALGPLILRARRPPRRRARRPRRLHRLSGLQYRRPL